MIEKYNLFFDKCLEWFFGGNKTLFQWLLWFFSIPFMFVLMFLTFIFRFVIYFILEVINL